MCASIENTRIAELLPIVQALAELYSFKPQLCSHKSSENADKSGGGTPSPDSPEGIKARILSDEEAETRRWTVQHVSLHFTGQALHVHSMLATR